MTFRPARRETRAPGLNKSGPAPISIVGIVKELIARAEGSAGMPSKYQSETAGLLQTVSIIEQTQRLIRFSTLHFEPPMALTLWGIRPR
ncbi:hypothetical protein GGD67_002569 [Bradyrhizobium sp. IAR9]|nr:hypothetical protein [Bradyrhizobium sp. IAR9]